MKLIGPSSAFAPLPTGHPLGLPGQMSVKNDQTRVVEPSKSSSTNLATHLGLPMRKPVPPSDDAPEQTRDPAKDVFAPNQGGTETAKAASAPPTILQLKINEILQAQASEKQEVAPALPEPEDTKAAPPASSADPQPGENDRMQKSEVRDAATEETTPEPTDDDAPVIRADPDPQAERAPETETRSSDTT